MSHSSNGRLITDYFSYLCSVFRKRGVALVRNASIILLTSESFGDLGTL